MIHHYNEGDTISFRVNSAVELDPRVTKVCFTIITPFKQLIEQEGIVYSYGVESQKVSHDMHGVYEVKAVVEMPGRTFRVGERVFVEAPGAA